MSAENIVRVIESDARRLPLDDSSVDAIVTDPPYELGFMGKSWDSTGVAYDPATWREALRVLKPGGHLLAFGGSRTWHRLAVAIDGCRVGPDVDTRRSKGHNPSRPSAFPHSDDAWTPHRTYAETEAGGRWPTNVLLSHLSTVDGGDACADGCVEGCPVAALDAQSGTLHSSGIYSGDGSRRPGEHATSFGCRAVPSRMYDDRGGASRFFPTFRYEPKAPSDERPTVDGVSHATVKPLDLIRWLCRLVTPPGSTLLDMFAGSGTMAEAAILEHFDAVVVDNEPTHIPLIELRVERARTKQIPGMSRLGSKKPIEVDPGADLLSWMDDNGAVTP